MADAKTTCNRQSSDIYESLLLQQRLGLVLMTLYDLFCCIIKAFIESEINCLPDIAIQRAVYFENIRGKKLMTLGVWFRYSIEYIGRKWEIACYTTPPFLIMFSKIVSLRVVEICLTYCAIYFQVKMWFFFKAKQMLSLYIDHYSIFQNNYGLVCLEIESSNRKDAGLYVCIAVNSVGKAESSATVIVEGRDICYRFHV